MQLFKFIKLKSNQIKIEKDSPVDTRCVTINLEPQFDRTFVIKATGLTEDQAYKVLRQISKTLETSRK